MVAEAPNHNAKRRHLMITTSRLPVKRDVVPLIGGQ